MKITSFWFTNLHGSLADFLFLLVVLKLMVSQITHREMTNRD